MAMMNSSDQPREYNLFQGGLTLCDMVAKGVLKNDKSIPHPQEDTSPDPSPIPNEETFHSQPFPVKPIERPVPNPYATPVISLPFNRSKYWGIDFNNMRHKLYVTDKWSNQVHILDAGTGQIVGEFGGRSTEPVEFHRLFRPSGLAVDVRRNRIMVVDKDNFRVSSFTMDGRYITSFGSKGYGPGQFDYPWDIDISPLGDTMTVTDSRNHRVQIFDANGNYLRHFSVFEHNPFEYKKIFDYPRGVTYDSDGGNVYISDFNKQDVMRIDTATLSGTLLIPPGFVRRPSGLTRDDHGNILLADSRNHCVRVMNSDGILMATSKMLAHTPVDLCRLGMGMGQQAAVLTSDGNIYVV